MTYEKVRPGGWRDRPYLSTALNPSALDHFEEGIYEASVAAENALPNTPEGRTELAASPELSAAFAPVSETARAQAAENVALLAARAGIGLAIVMGA